jgi:hypothetical protein
MFKLSVEFKSLTDLAGFVNKMGGEVLTATISHDQPLSQEAKEAKEEKAKKSRAKKEEKVEAPAVDLGTMPAQQVGAAPFPEVAAPTSFAPGSLGAPAVAQPTHIPHVAPVQPAAPAPSAPVIPAPVAEVSPQRKQYNDACIQLVNALQASGLEQAAQIQVLAKSFAEAGCAQGSRISTVSDEEIQRFYPILHANVSAVVQK